MLDHLWRDYAFSLDDDKRRKRLLEDTRTYTAAVRTEVLHTAGRVDPAIYNALNTARQRRNALAHRAKIDLQAAEDGLNAMKLMIEFLCETSVEPPLATIGINW
jgi:hypothetical protein